MKLKRVAIVGAGVIGRLCAYELSRRSHADISLFDTSFTTPDNASLKAGGMLAPFCEAADGNAHIIAIGGKAVMQWRSICQSLTTPINLAEQGSLVICHRRDQALLQDFYHRLERRGHYQAERLSTSQLKHIEPGLAENFHTALHLPHEARLNPLTINQALLDELHIKGVHTHTAKAHIQACGTLHYRDQTSSYDLILDCRGLGAKAQDTPLRGVRGEGILIRCPEVALQHTIRLLHPRIPLYCVPRGDHSYYLGATTLESEDQAGLRLQSALELLTAAYTLNQAFGMAEILDTYVGLRPAFRDNLPRVTVKGKVIGLNGFYRHGYLFGPQVVQTLVEEILDANDLSTLDPQAITAKQENQYDQDFCQWSGHRGGGEPNYP